MVQSPAPPNKEIVLLYVFLSLTFVKAWLVFCASSKKFSHGLVAPSISAFITLMYYQQDIKQFIIDSFFINGEVMMQCLIGSWTSGVLVLLSMAIGFIFGCTKIQRKHKIKKGKNIGNEYDKDALSGFIDAGGEELGIDRDDTFDEVSPNDFFVIN
eukprot:1108008_1